MSASKQELQALADEIFEILGVRVRAGQLVIHFNDGIVQTYEINHVFKAHRYTLPPNRLDTTP